MREPSPAVPKKTRDQTTVVSALCLAPASDLSRAESRECRNSNSFGRHSLIELVLPRFHALLVLDSVLLVMVCCHYIYHFLIYYLTYTTLGFARHYFSFSCGHLACRAGRDIHRAAVRGEPLPHRGEEVRSKAVRAGDVFQPAHGMALQRGVCPVFGLEVSDEKLPSSRERRSR